MLCKCNGPLSTLNSTSVSCNVHGLNLCISLSVYQTVLHIPFNINNNNNNNNNNNKNNNKLRFQGNVLAWRFKVREFIPGRGR